MAPPDEQDEDSEYVARRNLVAERFIELGGGSTIDMDLRKMPKLADLVTQQHRDMVKDLTASGLANEAVARIMGISKERLQALFEYELGTGYEIAHSSVARALYLKAVSGDAYAGINWIKLHNRSQWAEKSERTEKGQEQEKDVTVEAARAANEAFLAAMVSGIAIDSKLKRPEGEKRQAGAKVPDKVAVKKLPEVMKKPKGD